MGDTNDNGQLDSILESSDSLVVVLDGNLKVQRISRGTKRILGYEEQDIVGKTFASMVPEDRRDWMSAVSKRVREDGIMSDVFIHWRTKDGRRLISKSTVKSVVNYQQEVIGIIISEDASMAQAGEGAITPQQAIDMVQASEIALVVTDLSGNIISFSPGAEKLTGFASHKTIGSTIGRLFADRKAIGEITTKALRDGKLEDIESLIVTPTGSNVEVSVSTMVRRNAGGAATGFSFVMFNIARRKYLERELESRAEKLYLANELAMRIRSGKSLNEIYSVAHEGLSKMINFDTMTLLSTTSTDEGLKITSLEGAHPIWLKEGSVLPADRGPFADAMNDGRPKIYSPDDIGTALGETAKGDMEFEKGVAVPLFAGERLIGLLNFTSLSKEAFDISSLDSILSVADHIALAVESMRLLTALIENINIQTILMETGTAVRSEIDLKKAYPLAVEKSQEIVQCDRVALYMVEGDKLNLVAFNGDTRLPFYESIGRGDHCLPASVFFENGKAFQREISRSDMASEREKSDFGTAMMSKLVGMAGPMGLLYVAREKGEVPFTPYEFELLSLYCNHLAPSLENARLFATTRESEERAHQALDSEKRTYEALHFMISMLMHDSLNQIQGIQGYLELISQSDIPAEVQSYLDKAMRQVKAGSYLISGTSLVFQNIESGRRLRTATDIIKAIRDAMHRFATVFSNVEVRSRVAPRESEDTDVDMLLSELFFHVIRLMHKAAGSSEIEIFFSGPKGSPFVDVELRVEGGLKSGSFIEALSTTEGTEGSAQQWMLDPFLVRILSESYGAKITAREEKQKDGKGTDIVCSIEFVTAPEI